MTTITCLLLPQRGLYISGFTALFARFFRRLFERQTALVETFVPVVIVQRQMKILAEERQLILRGC
jgi:hypothetical protein